MTTPHNCYGPGCAACYLRVQEYRGSVKNETLQAENQVLREALKFYADGSHWTTNDDEMHFIKVTDQDWTKNESGSFVGGKIAQQALAKVTGERSGE